MTARGDIYIIIPAYNEASVLENAVVPLTKEGYTVVVVGDGSRDETWAILATCL